MCIHVSADGDFDEQKTIGSAPKVFGRVIIEQKPVVIGFKCACRYFYLFPSQILKIEICGAQIRSRATVVFAG